MAGVQTAEAGVGDEVTKDTETHSHRSEWGPAEEQRRDVNPLCWPISPRTPKVAVVRACEAGRGKQEATYEVPTIIETRCDDGLGQTSVDGVVRSSAKIFC